MIRRCRLYAMKVVVVVVVVDSREEGQRGRLHPTFNSHQVSMVS